MRDMLGETPIITFIKNMLFTMLKADFFLNLFFSSRTTATSSLRFSGNLWGFLALKGLMAPPC